MVCDLFGIIALVTSIIGLLPRVYKTYRTKSTSDISLIMLINYLVCSGAWIVYGTCISSDFVIYSNIVGVILSVVSIIQKVVYDQYNTDR